MRTRQRTSWRPRLDLHSRGRNGNLHEIRGLDPVRDLNRIVWLTSRHEFEKLRETTTGGSIIMPSDMSTALTTRSITRKGMKMTKPMMNAVCNSERMNAGTIVVSGVSSGVAGTGSPFSAA